MQNYPIIYSCKFMENKKIGYIIGFLDTYFMIVINKVNCKLIIYSRLLFFLNNEV